MFDMDWPYLFILFIYVNRIFKLNITHFMIIDNHKKKYVYLKVIMYKENYY